MFWIIVAFIVGVVTGAYSHKWLASEAVQAEAAVRKAAGK
jgi:hypothetical protein